MATLHASLMLRRGGDWDGTAGLLVRTALCRREAGAQPLQDTTATARSAHAAWRSRARKDAEDAAGLAGKAAGMLERFGEDRRARDVLTWLEADAMTAGG
ncbi:hypothetical protein ACFQ71_39125 [Streptomyces sp. NPDC056534]|uniref:hypothetical protein n=1 Tax=Streptomyces sp. NPDC056534 TaxID=3345857 RepID=UPI003677F759